MTEHDDEIKPDREGIFWKRLRESLGGMPSPLTSEELDTATDELYVLSRSEGLRLRRMREESEGL